MIRLFIPDPDPDYLPNPYPVVKNAPDHGSQIRIRNTDKNVHCACVFSSSKKAQQESISFSLVIYRIVR